MSDKLMPDSQSKPSISAEIGRFWWLFLFPAFLAAYFFVVFSFVSFGATRTPERPENFWLDTAVTIAPWSADALIERGEYLRAYAVTLEFNAETDAENLITAQTRSGILQDALAMFDQAIAARPFWPYYQLGALDVEYLLQSNNAVIQQRIDTILTLAPNERGLDRSLIEISLLAWHQLRPDQKRSIGQRLRTANHQTRREMINLIQSLLADNRAYCDELPWPIVGKMCAKK
tara:strand:- start:51 stop:746 length:696 start_codon:yes stop_codon:yes gene_type:complete